MDKAYAHRDAQALASLYHPNAKHPLPTGGVAVGRREIEKHLPVLFDMVPDDVETETISRELDLVTDHVAIVDLQVQNIRKTDEGREPVSVEGFTIVVIREDAEWLIAGMRGALVAK